MLRRSSFLFLHLQRENKTTSSSLFHHIFGFNSKSIFPLQEEKEEQQHHQLLLLDQYLLKNGLVKSQWWTLQQATNILQHKNRNSTCSSSSTKMTDILETSASSGIKLDVPYLYNQENHDNTSTSHLKPFEIFGSASSSSNEELVRDTSSSFVRAVREFLSTSTSSTSHHFPHSPITRNTVFLSFNRSQKVWSVIPEEARFDASLITISIDKNIYDNSKHMNDILETTFRLRNIIRREMKQEDAPENLSASERNVLNDRSVSMLRFCLFEEIDGEKSVESSTTSSTSSLIHLFPVEQLVPFGSLHVREPPNINRVPSVLPPFLLNPTSVPTTSSSEDQNAVVKTPKQQAEDELKKLFASSSSSQNKDENNNSDNKSNRNRSRIFNSAPLVPIPLPPSGVATLIAAQNTNHYSSSIWVRLDAPSLKSTQEKERFPTQKVPFWIHERVQIELKKQQEKEKEKETTSSAINPLECGVSRLSTTNNKLTPPPIPFNLYTAKKSTSTTTSLPPKSIDYANSLVNLVVETRKSMKNIPNTDDKDEPNTASLKKPTKATTTAPTYVTEHSESEAICISDLPDDIIQALPELRYLPKWVREAQQKILTGNINGNNTQDIEINKRNNHQKRTSANDNNSNNKKEVIVLGIFGAGFNMWKSVHRASIRRPQNHSAAFLFTAKENNNSNNFRSNEDDINAVDDVEQNHHNNNFKYKKNKRFFSFNNNNENGIKRYQNPRLFVTISYLRHATMCKDLESIRNFIDPEELDAESLESFLSKEKKKYVHDSKIVDDAKTNTKTENTSNKNSSNTNDHNKNDLNDDDDFGKRLRRRGLGSLRSSLEKFLSESTGHTVASFPKQVRQVKYVNFEQLKNNLMMMLMDVEEEEKEQKKEEVVATVVIVKADEENDEDEKKQEVAAN